MLKYFPPTETIHLAEAAGAAKRNVRQMFYVVLAALLCFVGPTYFVAVLGEVIPLIYAVVLGFASFVVGVALIVLLVKE